MTKVKGRRANHKKEFKRKQMRGKDSLSLTATTKNLLTQARPSFSSKTKKPISLLLLT